MLHTIIWTISIGSLWSTIAYGLHYSETHYVGIRISFGSHCGFRVSVFYEFRVSIWLVGAYLPSFVLGSQCQGVHVTPRRFLWKRPASTSTPTIVFECFYYTMIGWNGLPLLHLKGLGRTIQWAWSCSPRRQIRPWQGEQLAVYLRHGQIASR